MDNIQQKIEEYNRQLNELTEKENSLKVQLQVTEKEINSIKSELKSLGIDIDKEDPETLLSKIEKKIEELESQLTVDKS